MFITKFSKSWLATGLAFGLLGIACGDDDSDVNDLPDDFEIIDEIEFTFTSSVAGESVVITAKDPDGPGAEDFSFEPESITLSSSTAYDLNIIIRNTIDDEDVTEEIQEEAEEHLVIFTYGDSLEGEITDVESNYVDEQEGEDYPVGLASQVVTDVAGETTLRVILAHLPGGEKPAYIENPADGFDQDFNLLIPVVIED